MHLLSNVCIEDKRIACVAVISWAWPIIIQSHKQLKSLEWKNPRLQLHDMECFVLYVLATGYYPVDV